ncbi:unnamed protein product [Prorocentrum cordatum]|uniref:Uncharacterized protein n=1 Tax=Prorocentrum cordatum TaxID=2364126 RepID=A0ABN9QJA8_9DINO|nr:unnamed protein product [Polarella glacialis]
MQPAQRGGEPGATSSTRGVRAAPHMWQNRDAAEGVVGAAAARIERAVALAAGGAHQARRIAPQQALHALVQAGHDLEVHLLVLEVGHEVLVEPQGVDRLLGRLVQPRVAEVLAEASLAVAAADMPYTWARRSSGEASSSPFAVILRIDVQASTLGQKRRL